MRHIVSIFFVIAALIWGISFTYLSMRCHDLLEGISLLTIGTTSIIILLYWGRIIGRFRYHQQRHRFIQYGAAALSPTIEAVLFDHYGKMIWTTHPNTYPNQQEFLRKLVTRIDNPEQATIVRQMIENRQRGEMLLCSGGNGLGKEQKWRLLLTTPVEGSPLSGKLGVMAIIRDVTPYFENYNQLRNSYQMLESFIDRAPFGVYYKSRAGHILGLNTTFADWIGLKKDEIIGRLTTDFIHFSPNNSQIVESAEKNVSFFRAIIYHSEADPEQRYCPTILCRIDHLPALIATANLSQETAFLEAPIAAVVINAQGHIIAGNTAFSTMLGLSPNPETSIYDLIQDIAQEDVRAHITRSFDNKNIQYPFEIRFHNRQIQVTSYPSRPLETGKNSAQMMLQFIDISEQKRLEGQFIQSQKMQAVGQLAGGVAHDFNNLLTAMIGFCDLLLQRYLPNDPSYTDVVQIKQNANRAANLVRQLLAFSRQQTLQPKVIHITDSLVELSTLLRRLIGAGIDLKMIHGRDLWPIKADVSQLEQVIINLAVNSRDAMKDGGTLTISTMNTHLSQQQQHRHDLIPPGDYVTIDVTDTGCGITPENLEFIFEPFFSTKEVGEGTGLGLSTVYGIVKQTGGFVLVDSILNEGTTFKILFPRHLGALDKEEPVAPENTPSDLTGVGTVLLVEDEDAVRMFSARALREKGYRVLEAESGESALAMVKQGEKFDVLVTDVVMPKMDGPTLSKRIRDIYPETKTIFISGYTEDTFRKNLDHNTKIHFLPKPFTLKDLASKVKEVLTIK